MSQETVKTMSKPIQFANLSAVTHAFRMIGEPVKLRRHYIEDATLVCPSIPANPQLHVDMPCRTSYNGSLVVLVEEGPRMFGHHTWLVRCANTGAEMLVADEKLTPEPDINDTKQEKT